MLTRKALWLLDEWDRAQGAGGAGSAVVVRSGVLVSDSFNRADNALSLGVADTGQAWIPLSSTWGIIGNQAYTPGSNSNSPAVVDAGVSDCTVQVTVAVLTREAALAFRAIDASNFWMFLISSTQYTLWKVVGGSFTNVQNGALTSAAGDVLKVVLLGSTITMFKNGVQVGTPVNDSALQTATKHGITCDGNPDTTDRWDNFSVTP